MSEDTTQYSKSQDIEGTVIPRSKGFTDGRSTGFDPNIPVKVVIDPDVAGGGVEVDFASIAAQKDKFNAKAKALQDRNDASEFYKAMAVTKEPETQVEELLVEQKQKAEAQITKMQFTLPESVTENPVVQQYDKMYSDFRQIQSVPINIPFLESGKPLKPAYDVYFDLGEMGALVAKYHAVVVGNDCLCLIYDTRFEDGFQYLPPIIYRDVKIKLSVPKLAKNNDKAKTSFSCSSHGLNWTLGCLDVVVLLTHDEETS
jgi:hypothetical protein